MRRILLRPYTRPSRIVWSFSACTPPNEWSKRSLPGQFLVLQPLSMWACRMVLHRFHLMTRNLMVECPTCRKILIVIRGPSQCPTWSGWKQILLLVNGLKEVLLKARSMFLQTNAVLWNINNSEHINFSVERVFGGYFECLSRIVTLEREQNYRQSVTKVEKLAVTQVVWVKICHRYKRRAWISNAY